MTALVIIPARMGSSRLKNKPMADINGSPMIVHVWRRAIEAEVGEVVVATDHLDIYKSILSHGGRAVMTRDDHASGSDRVAEALLLVDPDRQHDIVVNLQGDLPTISSHVIRASISLLYDSKVEIGTAIACIPSPLDAHRPSVVKFVGTEVSTDRFRAIYFTRAVAPFGEGVLYQHIGIYVWRRAALERFIALPQSDLEIREKLEQLRAIQSSFWIEAALVSDVPLGIDTQDDLMSARRIMSENVAARAGK